MIELPATVEAGTRIPVQIAPFGDFEKDGVIQHIDQQTVDTLVAAFGESGKEVLVDCDHGSLAEDGSSCAMAWIKGLSADPQKGLIAEFEFTDVGAEAVAARRYRFVSPAWTLDEDGRPIELVSVALTNTPNLPVKPVVNRSTTNQKDEDMNSRLIEALGLGADATDDDIVNAVTALVGKVKTLEEAANDKAADEFVTENEDIVEDPEKLKAQYKSDPELTKAVVGNFRKTRNVVINAAKPKVVRNCKEIGEELAKLPPSEREAYFNTHK